ncbi:amino acid adenylation domain-containing protein [Salinispora arenicola]|uniref:amino acid adenylation domain-containing protein n=1 Tax=Salinispora arenicola TaxID=168697 RepID=UPI00037D95E3|nr:amino acid adenylation domain-containing protein [Salinispora arenicola]
MTSFLDELVAHGRRRPGAPAIVTPDTVITYGELVSRIDRLARVLVARGIGPEQVCAVAVERGPQAVVAMAAVLRAGAAFLTLDVELPGPRLETMVRSGQARCLVTTSALAGQLGFAFDGLRVHTDEPDPAGAVSLPPIAARSLAYVSHTSGSTGTPNAVLVEHRGLNNYLRCVVRDYDLGADTVVLQLAPLGYDASIRDTFAPLVAGGRLVLVPRSTLLRADEFIAAVRRFDVDTILSATPTFLTFVSAHDLPPLRLTVSSGESLRPFLTAGGRARLPGRLVNQYGPTEATMTSTRFVVPTDPDTTVDLVGASIEGVTIHVLDDDLAPVPDGAVGQVWIGGIGVTRGYGGRPDLTAERFVPDPLGGPGERMYRTGDLARSRDGILEYLGRADRQIKIRGYRVDPAEIEGALLSHPAVAGAAVSTATDDRGRVFLIAHVAGELAEVTDAALRHHLAATLPPYMMPRRFARIARVPTMTSGKADRRALTVGL